MSFEKFFNCCRKADWLGEPDFIADSPLDEILPPTGCLEAWAGRIVSTIYTAGAIVLAGKDFDGAREKLKKMDGHELKTIRTWDNVSLDTVYIPGTVKKAIILAPGLGDRFESLAIDGSLLKHIQKVIRDHLGDVTIVSPNVRGLGWSEGTFAPKRLHMDIYSVHQYLVKNQGFEPQDIFVFGESMGGCSGLRASELAQKAYPKKEISAISDRGFLRLTDVVEERTSSCCTGILRCIDFDVDCEEAAKVLNGKILTIGAEKDQTVPFASFFGNYPETKELKNLEVLYIIGDDSSPDPHTRYWLEEEQKTIGQSLYAMVFGNKPEEIMLEEVVVLEEEIIPEEVVVPLDEVKQQPKKQKAFVQQREKLPREAKNKQLIHT